MSASIVVSVVLWVVAVVATIWVLTPAIAFALSIGGVRTAVLADVGPPSVYGDQAVFDERMRELVALGYRDAARTRETALFMLPYLWRWRQFETTRWLVGPDGRTHATLSRLLRDEPPRIAFITLFDNGAIVRTTCPGTGGRMPSTPNYRVKELLGVTASELLAAHEQQVAVFAQERGVSARAASMVELGAATDAAERPIVRVIGNGSYGMVLPFAPALLFFAGGYVTGNLWSPIVPLGICAAGSSYAFKLWLARGPLRHVVTRRSHVGDALRERTPAKPAPAGPAEIAADGTTVAMRNGARVVRWVGIAAAVLGGLGPIVLWTHPSAVVTGGVVLIICQLFVVYVTAMVALIILRRERGGAPKPSDPVEDPSPRAWMVPASPLLIVLAMMNGSRFPYLYVVSGIVFAGLLIGRLLPLKSDD